MNKFKNLLIKIQKQNILTRVYLYFAVSCLLLFLAVLITLPLINSPLYKSQNINKSNAAGNLTAVAEDSWLCKDGEWVRHGSPKTSQPLTPCAGKNTRVKLPSVPPDSTVFSFFKTLQDKDTSIDNKYFTQKFIIETSNLKAPGNKYGYKPYLCSDNKLTNFTIKNHTIKNTTATVNIEFEFNSEKKDVSVILEAQGNKWMISDIDCKNLTP